MSVLALNRHPGPVTGLSTMMSWPQPATPWVRQLGSALHCASHLSNAGCG